MTFILHFYMILAETSLLGEAQGRQDQPQIDAQFGMSAVSILQYCTSSSGITLFCSLYYLHFMT